MSDNEILNAVKTMLFGTTTGTFRDGLIRLYINEVKDFMINAGVSRRIVKSEKSVGVIALGVNDLWNYQAGGVKFSEYVKQRVIQLAAENDDSDLDDKTVKTFTWYTKTTTAETTAIVFEIPQYDPTKDETINVFVNGMLCVKDSEYTIEGSTITFAIPKIENTEIIVTLTKLVDNDGDVDEENKYIVAYSWVTTTTEAETETVTFDIPQHNPAANETVNVFVNGMLSVENVDYTIDGSTITFTIPKIANTEIVVFVNKIVSIEELKNAKVG